VSSALPLARGDRIAQTDQAINAAIVAVLNSSGYSTLTLNTIGRACQMSTATVAKRFKNPSLAIAHAWTTHYAPIATRDLQALLTAAGLLDQPANRTAFARSLEGFRNPSPDWCTISELLIAATFDETLRAAVERDLQTTTSGWCTPNRPALSPTRAAQRAYLITLALGLTLIGVAPIAVPSDLTLPYQQLLTALQHPAPAKSIPDTIRSMPLEADTFDFHTEDPRERRLFTALLTVVAERGIDRATTRAIADAAETNEGILFNRYASKIDAFLDAITQHQAILMQRQNAAAIALSSDNPRALVDATIIQRSLHPNRTASRNVGMEYLRSARYHPAIADQINRTRATITEQTEQAQPNTPPSAINAWIHYGLALGAGLGVLPLLCPDAHTLPFNAVLEPLLSPPAAPPPGG